MRVDSLGNAIQVGRYISAPAVLSLGVGSTSVQLNPNRTYRMWSSVDAFFQFGGAGVSATTASHPLTAKLDTLHSTDATNNFIAGIVSAGSGLLFISDFETGVS